MIETQKELLSELTKEPDSQSEEDQDLAKYKEKKNETRGKRPKNWRRESLKHLREHVPLSRGLTMFQVAIAVGAISVLTRRREFWFVCLAFGVVGVGFLIWGLVA